MNYAQLQQEIVTFAMRRGDTEFEAAVPSFIRMAESKLNRRLQLRVMQVDADLVGTVGSRLMPLPADFVEPYALHLTTSGVREMRGPDIAGQMPIGSSNGTPSRWCVNGENIELDTPCDQAHTFSLRYRKSFALSEAAPTNWLLDNHPDVYLQACLLWGCAFVLDREVAGLWKGELEQSIEEIGWLDARSIAIAPLKTDLAASGGFNIVSG